MLGRQAEWQLISLQKLLRKLGQQTVFLIVVNKIYQLRSRFDRHSNIFSCLRESYLKRTCYDHFRVIHSDILEFCFSWVSVLDSRAPLRPTKSCWGAWHSRARLGCGVHSSRGGPVNHTGEFSLGDFIAAQNVVLFSFLLCKLPLQSL